VNCLPVVKELCDMAKFINMKVIRITNKDVIKDYVLQRPDVQVVHLVSFELILHALFFADQ